MSISCIYFFKKISHCKIALPQKSFFTAITLSLVSLCSINLAHADVAALTVSDNKILIGGQEGSLAGNSLFWSNTGWGGEKYYNANVVAWLKTDWHASLVRASMGVEEGGGYLNATTKAISDATNKTRVYTVVDAAIANDMYVIIDWHTHKAENYKAQAITFFQEVATKYKDSNNVIYEIYNEPLNTTDWSTVIKPYAVDVIAAIRAIDPDNLIIVGTQTWSQDVDKASIDPILGYDNIAYTLHFYAGTHKQSLRDKAQTALNNGIALFVTEWGSVEANGDGLVATSEVTAWMNFLRTNKISHANWALNDKTEGASALVAGASANGGWVSSQLTASGALTKDFIINWPAIAGSTSSGAATSSASSVVTSSAVASSTPASVAATASSRPASVAASSKPASKSGSGGGSVNFWQVFALLAFAGFKFTRRKK